MFSIHYCNCGDPAPHPDNYNPVHVGINTLANAERVAQGWRGLHPKLLWAVVDNGDGDGFDMVSRA